jgi:hypothetical protein
MKARRRWIIGASAALALLLLLVALPYLFRGTIATRVQADVSRSVEADVSWRSAGLSVLRDFPHATLRLADVAIVGRPPFAGDTLAHVPQFRLVVSLPSVLRSIRGTGPLDIRSIDIHEPRIQLVVLDDGTANWNLGKPVPDDAEPSAAVSLSLRSLVVRNGSLSLENAHSGLTVAVSGLQQTLSADLRQSRYTAQSRTHADAVSVRMAGVPYLHRVGADITAEFDVDADAGTITLPRADMRLNELLLAVSGTVAAADDRLGLDLSFRTPGTSFHEILSLLPMLHAQPEFAQLRTSGTMAVSGFVRGEYGSGAFPAFELLATVRDGAFQYPDLPLPARDVSFDLALSNPGGDPDSTVARIDHFNVVIGNDPITGSFAMRTPVSDPDVDFQLRGRLDLAALNRTIKLQGAEELSGVLTADASVRARRSAYDDEAYDRIAAAGTVEASQIVLRLTDLPHALRVDDARLRLTPRHADLDAFRGTIGRSDVDINGRLDNLFAFAFRDEELRGSARIRSGTFDLDEWRSDDEMQAVQVPANIDFALQAEVGRLVFAALDLRNARGSLRIHEQRATLEDFRLEAFDGTLAVSGFYESLAAARPVFDVAMRIDSIDVAQAALSMPTFRTLAPAARYAQGRVSTDLQLSGALGEDMTPVYDILSGRGTFETSGLALHGFPAFGFLADRLRTEQLRNPGLIDVRSTFQVRDGRLHISPFNMKLADQYVATVSGSHGFDDTLDYTLALQLPRALLGAEANGAVATLAAQAGRAGVGWETSDVITVGVRFGGTVAQPSLATDLQGTTRSVLQDAGGAVRDVLDRRIDAVDERADAALEEARLRAAAEAARLVEEAERQAERIRAEAETAAAAVRTQGYERADALVAQAGNPAARLAANAAADRVRREADAAADRILREADERADAVVAEAMRGGGPPER